MRKSLKIMNYKFNQAQSTNRIILPNLRPCGEGAEIGEDVELLDGLVSALEEGDRVVVVMLMAYLSSSVQNFIRTKYCRNCTIYY